MPTRFLPLLLLLVVFGCAKSEIKVEGVIVTDVIDIGRIRVSDSPVKTSFSIANRASVSVEIDEILSGCGCTVIDLPQKTIRPGDTMEVPVKIDLFGRKGDFNTDLLVRSTSGESWHVRVTGKIIEDIWYAGQSIRLHIDPEQETTSREFSIGTVDYPNVQFEFGANDPDIRLSEISRSTQDGETRILFRLTRNNEDLFRTSARIELRPTNVDLPVLELPVYYNFLSGGQEHRLSTSQINLGGIKPKEEITVKVYGNQAFLRNVRRIQAVSRDDVIAVVSHAVPESDSDHLEIILMVSGDELNVHELVRGSITLFSHDDNVATVQVSGIVVPE